MAALVIFGLIWVVAVAVAAMKVRAETRLESVEGFQRQLRSFGGGLPPLKGAPALGPPVDEPVLPKAVNPAPLLRHILAGLLVAVVVSLVYAVVASTKSAWGLHLFVNDCLIAYLALLVRRRDARAHDTARARRRDPKRSVPGVVGDWPSAASF